MAEVAVKFVLSKLGDAALKEALELYNVSAQVEPMLVKLNLIQGFLKDADSKRNKNESVKRWVKQVREVAHKIEDAMDLFRVEIDRYKLNLPEYCGCVNTLTRCVMSPLKLARFRDEIKNIEASLETIDKVTTQLGIRNIGDGSEENGAVPFRPSKLHQIDVSEIVGFASDASKIIGHLLDKSILRLIVFSIVGQGGLGKTTLAKKVYESAELKEQFDLRMWLSISQKFNLTNLLSELLCSINPQIKNRVSSMTEEGLSMELKKSLSEKRYLIILDDVWRTDLWDQLKLTLPDIKNGSRVLITTRFHEVARAADQEQFTHQLPYLNEKESLALLLRKALPHEHPDNYPPEITNLATNFTKMCDGLPLALVVVGGILSRRDPSTWRKVKETMDWHDEKGGKCSQVLALSYNDLPYHLKQCFLYFASFPEDYKISAKHVTRMWIAEGFIIESGAGTLEDRAENYLEELAQRCLVQPIKKSWTGYCNEFIMHDLLRDLAVHEAEEENFFTAISKREDGSQLNLRGARRASLQVHTTTVYCVNSTNIRSLFFFGECISNFGGFKLLRVLTIVRVDMTEKQLDYKKWLKGLIHLRYLGFINCYVLPPGLGCVSFSSFNYLETLYFKGTLIRDQPNNSLWKVPSLRNVIYPPGSTNLYAPSKWDDLKNLQTLKWVVLKSIPELECNLNLRKIGIGLLDEFWKQCGTVERAQHMLKGQLKWMNHLVSLSVRSNSYVPFPIGGTRDLPCHDKIQKLALNGIWPKHIPLTVEMFPTNLAKLEFYFTEFEEDSIATLERLQCLRIMKLGYGSYVRTKMICSTGGFPSLQQLELRDLWELRDWVIEERAMPKLRELTIGHCYKLEALPELQKVPSLKVLKLIRMDKLWEKAQAEEAYKIQHIPTVLATRW